MKYPIPRAALDQNVIVLGKTGAGKSSAARSIAEPMLEEQLPVCIIDPKGDWWGVKLSADGKRPGYPLVIFGGKHADVPINQHSGNHIAELFATGNRPCLIDLRGWMPKSRGEFFVDFASTLYQHNVGRKWLLIDECHNFAPKGKVLDPQAGLTLHWANKLASEGRGLGINLIGLSQRPQKVHNDFLTSCETLIALRVLHKSDRDAYRDWIDGCGDPAKGAEMLRTIANLKRGTGWVWSPEIEFGPELVTFKMFKTYDSFKPQEAGDAAKLTGWADVNLDDVKARLANVIEEHKANDPAELKKRIRDLERQIDSKRPAPTSQKGDPAATPRDAATIKRLHSAIEDLMKFVLNINATGFAETAGVDPDAIKKAIESAVGQAMKLVDANLAGREKTLQRLQSEGGRLIASVQKLLADQEVRINVDVKHSEPFTVTPARGSAPARSPVLAGVKRQTNGAGESLPKGEAATLAACIQFPDGLRREQLTVLTSYKRSSRDAYIQRLRERGYLEAVGDRVSATEAGIAALPDAEPLPTGPALQDYWLTRLPEGERKILGVLINRYPRAVPRSDLDEETGYQRSSRDAYLQRLRAKQLILEPSRGEVKASGDLFS